MGGERTSRDEDALTRIASVERNVVRGDFRKVGNEASALL